MAFDEPTPSKDSYPFLAAGTIRGKILDASTGEPLIGANVFLTGTTIGTITDFDGNFSLADVEAGKYVYVRGLSDRYSSTTLNGAQIPGLDPEKNTVQMDPFPG
ncbi:MAG: carboxypeptidase-like regulatory domain-containing protein [Bacteroidales bacterium]|nr:carboxypeptidase-like regulatory domain-containing protein [Bacteroidales bacterium]